MKRIYLLLVVLGMGAGIWAGLWSLMPPDGPDAVTVDAPTLEGVPVPSICSIEAIRIQDVSRINPAEVSVVCRPRAGSDWSRAEHQIRAVLAYARKRAHQRAGGIAPRYEWVSRGAIGQGGVVEASGSSPQRDNLG